MDDSPPRFPFPRHAIAAVAAGALVLRVVYVFGKRDQPPLGDAVYYSSQAELLARGKGFVRPFFGGPAADHPPLTSLAMTPVVWVTDSLTAQRLAMAVIGVAVVIACAYLGHLVAGPRAAVIAGVIAAVYPNLWMNDALVMSDTLTALFVALFLIAMYRWRERPSVGTACLVGLAAGLGTLTRAEIPLLVVLVAVPVMLSARSLARADRLRCLAATAVVAGLVLAPWVIPNLVRFDRPVLLSSNDGITLIGANCDNTYENVIGFWDLTCAPTLPGDQSVQSAEYRRLAVDYVGDHLDRVPAVVAARVGRVWSAYRPYDMVYVNQAEGREAWASRLGIWSYWALLPFAAAGWWTLRQRRQPTWTLVAPFVTVTVVAAVFYGITRFRVPAEVSIVVLSAVALARISRSERVATQSTDVPKGSEAPPSRTRSASVSPIAAAPMAGDV
ncbi:MAG: ArnT family glycosyltransferase [Acidimicrobiales bacterium]